jgi:hypothetical protein
MMNDACRAANLPALLTGTTLPPSLKNLWPAFQDAFRSDIRGSRLNDILAFGEGDKIQTIAPSDRLKGRRAKYQQAILPIALSHTGSKDDTG